MSPSLSTDIAGLRVLLVDDEVFIREMGSDVLTTLGCIPTVTSDGKEAWKLFRKDPRAFDVIVSDYNMPEMTGIDLASRVLNKRAGMPFIISTGFASGFTGKQAGDLGISSVLQKPYLVEQLKDAISVAVTNTART